jgi:AcrR family transcriptional regulator
VDKRSERGGATRRELLRAATTLFAELGYEATSTEAVLQRSGISRGSLYHHFANKRALFEAVLDEVEANVAQGLLAAAADAQSPREALRAGCSEFLRLATTRTVRQIVLIDAPTAVGWEKWREIDERHAFGMLRAAVAAIDEESSLEAPPELIAHMLLASLIELAMVVARASRPKTALREAGQALDVLIDRLLPPARG